MKNKSLDKLYLNRGRKESVSGNKVIYIYFQCKVIDIYGQVKNLSVLSESDIIAVGIDQEHFLSLTPGKRFELIENLGKEERDKIIAKISDSIERFNKSQSSPNLDANFKLRDILENYSSKFGVSLIVRSLLELFNLSSMLNNSLIEYNKDKKANNVLKAEQLLNSLTAIVDQILIFGESLLSCCQTMPQFAGVEAKSYATLHNHIHLIPELIDISSASLKLICNLRAEEAEKNNITLLSPSDPGFEEVTDPRACAFTTVTLDTASIDSHSKKGSSKKKASNNDSSNEKNAEELHDIGDNLSFIGTQDYNPLLSIDKAAEKTLNPAKVINEEEEESILSQEYTDEDLLVYDQLDDEQDDEDDLNEVERDRNAKYNDNQLKMFKDPTEMDFSTDSTSNRSVITSSTTHEEIEQVTNSLIEAISPVRNSKCKNIPQLSSTTPPSHLEKQTKKKVKKHKHSSGKTQKRVSKTQRRKAKDLKKYLSANNQRTYKTGKKAIKGAVTIDTFSKIAARVKAYSGNTSDIVIFFYEIIRLRSLASNPALSGMILPLMLICDRIFFCSPVVFELVGLGVHFVIAAKKQLQCWREGKDKLWMLKNAIIDWCKKNGFLYTNLFKESNIIMRERLYKEIDFASLGIDPNDFAIQLHNRTINLKMKTEYTATQHETLSCFKLDDDGKQHTRTVTITYVVSLSLDHYYSSLNRYSEQIRKVQEAVKSPEVHFRGLTYKVANRPKEGDVIVHGVKFFAPEVLERKAFDDALFITATSMVEASILLILSFYDLRINVERVIHLMKNVNEMAPLRTAEESAVDARMFFAQLSMNMLASSRMILNIRHGIDMSEEQIKRPLRNSQVAHFADNINYCIFEDYQKLLIKETTGLDIDERSCILTDDEINIINKPKLTTQEQVKSLFPTLFHSQEFLKKQENKQKQKQKSGSSAEEEK